MKNKFKLNKELFKYIPIILLFPVALNFILFSFDLGISYGDGNVWLAFWGNYSGGVISALVAYFVANSQIKKQVSLDLNKRHFELATNQLPALIRIKIELEKFIEELERVKVERELFIRSWGMILPRDGSKFDPKDIPEEPSREVPKWVLHQKNYNIELANEEVFKYLERVEDIDLHIDLINAFNFYSRFSKGLLFDIEVAKGKKDKIQYEVVTGANTSYASSESELELLQIEIDKAYKEKTQGWETLYNQGKIEEFKNIFAHLNQEIERTIEVKKRGTMGV